MTEQEIIAAIRGALARELDERDRIDAATHHAHHAFVANLVECSERRRTLIDAITKQVLGWGIVALLAWIGLAVYQAAKSAL